MSGHTPGPWHRCDHYIRSKDDAYICDIKFPVEEDPEILANARLIAAAPELLAALKEILEDPRFDVRIGGNPNAVETLYANTCAAIAKAEGR